MFCTNCEFEIKGEGRKKCPICGGLLIDFSELDPDTQQTKTATSEEKQTVSNQGSTDAPTFDLASLLNEDEEKPSRSTEAPVHPLTTSENTPEPESELDEISTEELLRRIAEEYKPAEEEVTEAAGKPEPLPVPSSRPVPAMAALAVLAFIAAIASIAYLNPQEKLSPVIGQLKTETEKTISKISHIVLKEERSIIVKKELKPGVHLQKAQPDKSAEKIALYKELPTLEKAPPVAEKSTAAKKAESASTEKTVTEGVTQPQIDSVEGASPPPQEKFSPQITEQKEKIPVKQPVTKGTRKNLYSLHTGSFIKESIASAESERLRRMGFNSYVQEASLKNGQTWYRIKVGSFSTRKEAEEIQEQLQQKAPHIKSYIMRKRVPSRTIVADELTEAPKEGAVSDPVVSVHREKTPSHEKQDVVDAGAPIKEAATTEEPQTQVKDAPELPQPVAKVPKEPLDSVEEIPPLEETVLIEAEQTAPEMNDVPDTVQPMAEPPQETLDLAEEALSPAETVVHEEEIITEMDPAPYIQETVEEETTLEDTVSIETLPVVIPEQEDQAGGNAENTLYDNSRRKGRGKRDYNREEKIRRRDETGWDPCIPGGIQ